MQLWGSMTKANRGAHGQRARGHESRQVPRSPSGAAHDSRRIGDLYRLLIESVTDYAIFVLDPEGRIASWNPGAARLKGYSELEIIGRHFSIFHSDDDVTAGKPENELAIATREGRVEDEGWRLKKDGSRFWANVVITALHDDSGALVGFAKITQDLTKRREAEEQARELAASEAERRRAVREKDEVLALSRQLKEQTDEYRAQTEEMQALAAELEETNDELASAISYAKQAALTARSAERQARYLVKTGDILASSLNHEQTLQALADVVVPELADWCGVSVVDGQTVRQVAIAHVDPGKVRLARELSQRYPQDPDAATGVPNVVRTGKPELHADIPDDLLVAAAKDREHLRILRELGMKSAMIVPLIAHGQTLGALTLISSASGRRYSEDDVSFAMELARRAALAVDNSRAHRAELRARKQAEHANRAKMDFLGVMSHELRTPLNAIAGYAELLKIGVHGPLTPQQEQDVDRIIRSERGLLALINDVLNYAKLEAGHVDLRLAAIEVQDTLLDIEASVLPQLNAKKLEYQKDLCPARVRGDADKLRQIILNLLSNAIKFTDAGGTIAVNCNSDGETVKIVVSDTGRGIPQERLDVIFDPFVQVDRHLTRQNEGAGLGLAISRDLAHLMHGDLTVSSELGKGSTFTLHLPDANAA